MARPITAMIVFDIPGRRRGGVRVHRPAAGKASYRVVWQDDEGRQRERTSTDLAVAEALAEQIAKSLAANQPMTFRDLTLGDLLVYYLDGQGRSAKWTSEKSARRPAQIARRILTEADLATPTAALCALGGHRMLQAVMTRAAQSGCKVGGTEYAKAGALLKTIFDVGARDGLIDLPHGNPMENIRYRLHQFTSDPEPQMLTVNYIGPELRPPTARVRDFIDATRSLFGAREALYVETLAFAGTRPGEANALTRAHLRQDHPGLRIEQQVLELTAAEAAACGGASQQLRPPKWGQMRNAYLPLDLLHRLAALADTRDHGPSGVLFPAPSGGFRWQGNWRRDVFTPVAEHVGWPSEIVTTRGREERHWIWPVYAFRHHYANYLIKDLQQPIVAVARCMGHRDVRVTERMYVKTELADLDAMERAHLSHNQGSAP